MTNSMWHVYLLKCSDNSIYVGHTTALTARITRHNQGRAARWTSYRRPVLLIYYETYGTETDAVQREQQIKRWSRAKKMALAKGDRRELQSLSKKCR